MLVQEDTIAAIATPKGVGGIGIIRISGPKAEEIGHRLFKPQKCSFPLQSHHLYYGNIVSLDTGAILDEALLSIMRKPHSYTGEDTIEINCHGGPIVLEAVLHEAVKAGSRLAEPGEFTKRAYLNGRLDLAQAEAVIDLIMAQSNRGLSLALSHLKGNVSQKVHSLRSSLIEILAHLETLIDFTEEDINISPSSELADAVQHIIDDIEEILATYSEGKTVRDGLSIIITGKPNVGKSSLLNRLLGEKRAIITPIPGTTRDFIEEALLIKGIPVKLIDTAGIREVKDQIEAEGIKLVWEKISSADIVIILLDGSTRITEEDLEVIEKNKGKEIILAVNKSDLPSQIQDNDLGMTVSGVDPIWISAKYGDGIPQLTEKIYELAVGNKRTTESDVVLSNLRHKVAFEKARDLLTVAYNTILQGLSPELAAFDIKESLEHLGDIIGETTNEDVLDRIFSTFCIGK
ncbi:MAG: tRNA uridine-5-carboxymethylaminomethyl(34) synthesis GTPase MnmE [Deltaproteobacteria bacterium]|nr:tRNA uridine-5-carboxymethylaminomethyl(34) synthesis GTPase MnmE [Deltaproteobacteria bacterium]